MAAITRSSGDTIPALRGGTSRSSWIRVSLFCAAAAALVAYLGSATPQRSETPDLQALSQSTSSLPVWEPLVGSRALFAADLLDDVSLERSHSARSHREGGREDGLSIGSAEAATFARIAIARGRVGPEPANFYVDAVRRAAAAGASVMRLGQSLAVPTKLGTLEAAPIVVSAGSERACLAFRFSHGDIDLRLHGFLCRSRERATTEQELACFIDGITYFGTEDPALKLVFAQADKRRVPGCGPAPRTVAAHKP